MRIGFLAYRGNMQSGGQGLYLYALTRELARLGHEIDVFVGPPLPDEMPWARVAPVENHMFWGARFKKEPGAFLPRPDPLRALRPLNLFELAVTRFGFFPEPFAFSVRAARALMARMREGVRYDLVHDVQSVGYGLLWLQALGLPVVTTIHHPLSVDLRMSLQRDQTFSELKGSLTFYPVRTQRRVARRLDGVLTSSRVAAREIERDFGVREERLHVVGNGVDLPASGSPRRAPARPQLLFVGRCGDPNKGLEFLLSALALLPDPVTLRVLDAFPSRTPLSDRIDALNLRHRIRFDGKVSKAELDAAYREAAVVVLPSLFEGFGLPAVEALAVGTPIVATTAGALREVVLQAGAGKLVPPADPPGLAKAIAETLEQWDAEHRRALDARARIDAAFSWPRIATRTEQVYREVIGRR